MIDRAELPVHRNSTLKVSVIALTRPDNHMRR